MDLGTLMNEKILQIEQFVKSFLLDNYIKSVVYLFTQTCTYCKTLVLHLIYQDK